MPVSTKEAPLASAKSPSGRGRRSREATRRKLIDAALTVMSRKGIDGAAINDITEEADVGFGSFYNHFASKNEIARIVFELRASELAAFNDQISERETNAAVAVAHIQRLFLTKAVRDPVWGWFVLHATNGLPEMSRLFMERGKRDIEHGVAQGLFSITSVETAMRIILAALLGTMRTLLEGEAPPATVNDTIECLLRMLGVSPEEARDYSRRRLPLYIKRHFPD